ncbi:MAG: hypothetical protein IKG89_03805 [Oscillospiraceae bacterium]|nr:hypothetical protein [Oscillospiraceae bacterium]
MKKALILLSILLLLLLTACSGEAKEPVPDWPDRLTGEYDDALTFTYRGGEPTLTGADSLTGRMTALFSLEDGGTLALGWRRLAGAEVELLEDFLKEAGGTAGVWTPDGSAPNTVESYVRLGRSWYALSAACGGLEDSDLLALVDGTVEAKAEKEAALPGAASSLWPEELPWDEDWTCLILGWRELEPEAGKEALRDLLYTYDWALIDPEAKQPEPIPEARGTAIYLDEVYAGRETVPIRFWFAKNGDVYWNGSLLRPLGENAGESLLADWTALAGTGISVGSPPALTYTCGEESAAALVHGTYSWSYTTRIGEWHGAESDAFALFYDYDWLGLEAPILRAEGDVVLSFPTREPDILDLTVFTSLGQAPVELRDGRFTPFAGVNTYALSAHWEKAEQGGFGSCIYILLVEGDGPAELPQPEAQVSGEVLEADAYGCVFTLENRENVDLNILANQSTWNYMHIGAYSLFRRSENRGWEWMKPIRYMENRSYGCPAGERLTRGLDWSYDFGVLEPGEYTLLLSCRTLEKYKSWRQYIYLPLTFTLEENCMPEAPGPKHLSASPAGVESRVERLSQHRFYQVLNKTGEGTVYAERDFALFRQEEDGTLTFIPPKFHLPAGLNYHWPVTEGESGIVVDLAAYGPLDRGAYVVRRRVYIPETGEDMTRFDVSWRTLPEKNIRYLDAPIFLNTYRDTPKLGVEPMTQGRYAGEETEWPLAASNSYITPENCRVYLENLGDKAVYFNTDSARLWYYDSAGDWLPLEMNRHPANGLLVTELVPEAGRDFYFAFTPAYQSLTKGTYRLVLPMWAEDTEEQFWLVLEFNIRADGTGQFHGMLRPAEITLENYRRELGEHYVWPEDLEVLSAWNVWNSTGRSWTSDPYTAAWTAERLNGRLRVTVRRDRDVQRAKDLLGKFGCVEVVRGQDEARRPVGLREDMMGTLGVLQAEVLEQTDPALCREGTWLLSLEVKEEVQVDEDFVQNVWPEVWDAEAGTWYALADHSWFSLLMQYPTVTLEPGAVPLRVVSLGWYKAEFLPGEQYRFVLMADGQPGSEVKLEYYTCPFTVNEGA